MSEHDKHAPQVAISDAVIEEALKSVQRRPADEEQAGEPQSGPGAPAPDLGEVADDVDGLREQLLQARQDLRQREAELEASQLLGRDTTARLREEHDRLLRAAADLENYKRRVQKEKEDQSRFGQEKLLKEFLPVLDNLDRALDHARSPDDFEALKVGIQMTRKLFEDTFARFGVKGFSALDTLFDPHLHEAMQAVESDQPPNTVLQEMVRGYQLHDRLIRPAMVVVAKARVAPVAAAPAEEAAPAAADAAPGASDAEATAQEGTAGEASPDETTEAAATSST